MVDGLQTLQRKPSLLLVDDLSSALDIDTESRLWQRVAERLSTTGATCLAVSHRRPVIERADVVISLDRGRKVG